MIGVGEGNGVVMNILTFHFYHFVYRWADKVKETVAIPRKPRQCELTGSAGKSYPIL